MKERYLKSINELLTLISKEDLLQKQLELHSIIDSLRFTIPLASFSLKTKELLKSDVDNYVNLPCQRFKNCIVMTTELNAPLIAD